MESLIIPGSLIEIGDLAFENCCISSYIRFLGSFNSILNRILVCLDDNGYIEVPAQYKFQYNTSHPKYTFNNKYNLDIEPYIAGLKIKTVENVHYDSSIMNLDAVVHVQLPSGDEIDDFSISNIPSAGLLLNNLAPSQTYDIFYIWKESDDAEEIISAYYDARTNTALNNFEYSTTQTSITVTDYSVNTDETFNPTQLLIGFNDSSDLVSYTGSPLTFSDLQPGSHCYLGLHVNNVSAEYSIANISIRINGYDISTEKSIGPTTIILDASYYVDDATPHRIWWKFEGNDYENHFQVFNSLNPESWYNAEFNILYRSWLFSNRISNIKTSALELTTLQPRCVSEGCAIVAAETNMMDEETNAGFEWRKYDAPESLPSNKAFAVVCDGKLEGYIKNLQPTSYYNVRAFYESASGYKYYGDWVTFDPSDFSYFEPTVRTYPAENIGADNATLRGYVLQGTDDITRQGFQYWKSGPSYNYRYQAPSDADIMTVEASGQVMFTTLDNLNENADYTYRVFVETKAGFVFGDEMSFTTLNNSGIEDVTEFEPEKVAPTIVGYYNLSGTKFDEPQPGFNIVLYSDGTSKKYILK